MIEFLIFLAVLSFAYYGYTLYDHNKKLGILKKRMDLVRDTMLALLNNISESEKKSDEKLARLEKVVVQFLRRVKRTEEVLAVLAKKE